MLNNFDENVDFSAKCQVDQIKSKNQSDCWNLKEHFESMEIDILPAKWVIEWLLQFEWKKANKMLIKLIEMLKFEEIGYWWKCGKCISWWKCWNFIGGNVDLTIKCQISMLHKKEDSLKLESEFQMY